MLELKMTKVQQIIILLSFTLLTSVVVHATTLEEHVIEVRGQSSVSVTPDNFSLTLAIVQIGRNISKLRSLVDHKSNQVINIAESLDISPGNINSARVNLWLVKDHSVVDVQVVDMDQKFPQNNSGKVYAGTDSIGNRSKDKTQNFELSRTITVKFLNIEDYDKFLNKVIKVGVERIYPLTMSVTNSDNTYQQALAKAIDNAKEKAKQVAKQANVILGKLVYLKELSSNHYQARLTASNMYSESTIEHHSQVADTIISASVLVKFAIKE